MNMQSLNRMSWIAVIAVIAFLPSLSLAQPVSDRLCGTMVTADLVLDHDVTCYNTDGLIIGVNGVTIDLNGKTIRCRNGGLGHCRGSGLVGIDASKVNRVIINGPGTVIGFDILFVKGRCGSDNPTSRSTRTPATRAKYPVIASRSQRNPSDDTAKMNGQASDKSGHSKASTSTSEAETR